MYTEKEKCDRTTTGAWKKQNRTAALIQTKKVYKLTAKYAVCISSNRIYWMFKEPVHEWNTKMRRFLRFNSVVPRKEVYTTITYSKYSVEGVFVLYVCKHFVDRFGKFIARIKIYMYRSPSSLSLFKRFCHLRMFSTFFRMVYANENWIKNIISLSDTIRVILHTIKRFFLAALKIEEGKNIVFVWVWAVIKCGRAINNNLHEFQHETHQFECELMTQPNERQRKRHDWVPSIQVHFHP